MEYLFDAADVPSPAQHETGLELLTEFGAADSALSTPEPSLPLVDVDRHGRLR
jgi:hypothetical protein